MHCYNARKAFFQTDPRAGLVWPYSENFIVLNLREFSFLLIHVYIIKIN